MTQLHDLHVCFKDPLTKVKRHIATLKYNIPYSMAKGERAKLDSKKYPKGTYFPITKNGELPLNKKKDGVSLQAALVEKTTGGGSNTNRNMGIDGYVQHTLLDIPEITKAEERYMQRMYLEGKINRPETIEELPEDY